MDSLPKLLPVWPNAAEHALAELVDFSVDAKYQPDFGGAGVDVQTNDDGLPHFSTLKCHDSRRNKLSAQYLTLPLSVPNRVASAVEPCLQYQLDLNRRIRAFESTIGVYRGYIKRKGPFASAVQEIEEALMSKKPRTELRNMNIHRSLLELIQIQPESFCYRDCNWDFTGGCLATIPHPLSNGSILLAHPSGDELDKLAISEYQPAPFHSKEAFLEKQSSLVLESAGTNGTIFQVSLQHVQKETTCCVRLRNSCQYIRLFDTLKKEPAMLSEFSYDSGVCCTTPSKHIFGELVAITEDGNVLLQQCDRTEPSWRASVSHERPSSNQWWCTSFGSHPRHICYMDRSGLYSLDARRPGSRKHTFCTIQHEAFLKDEFMLFEPNPLNCHQLYLASSKMLSVWDERHTRQPVLTWNHCLQHSPTFLEFTPFQDFDDRSHRDLYVTLGSQRSRQVAIFHVRQDSLSVQPISLVPPWHLSRPSDFAKHLEHQGCTIDEHVLRRVKAPLIGGCMVDCGSGAFSALQLTSYGDIFHQDFVRDGDKPLCRSDWNFSAGCKLLPVPEIEQRVKWWTDLVIATDTVNKDGPEKHPLLVNHFIQYRGVASDDNDPLTQRNRAKLSNLQNMIIQAMNENKTLSSEEWKQAVTANSADISQDESGVDEARSSLEAIHLGTWDRTARRYLELWTETTGCPLSTSEKNEDAHASIMEFSQDCTGEQKQQEEEQHLEIQGKTWQGVLHGEGPVMTLTSRAANPSTDMLLQNTEPEYYDPSQPLFDENDLTGLTQVSVTPELRKSRQPSLSLKKKKVVMDGF
ncbi:uncharacterized protein LOC119164785 [Rhipicephalus microplus]|uniref:uncharacterized protein LOC119164785 n=1 Tax=Rhipicephalus microplus TaxID=6941 RepID=UPI003F6ABF76